LADALQSFVSGLTAMSGWELLGAILGIAYLVLAIRQNIWCWAVAAVGEIIFMFVMFDAQLYMESMLRVFYLVMAIYGWFSWRSGQAQAGSQRAVTTLPLSMHCVAILAVAGLVLVSGSLLSVYTDAALPYWDSFTTWSAMFATWLVARKIIENWYYWFVIDAVSAWLYVERGLVFVAFLYLVYLVMIVYGFRAWQRSMQESHVDVTPELY
jgi:nicotinamide mononucleotide transporter|tara:strand:- start:1009 stop:1641 length:633 start_codon:yes stop_codon:yes gene_type:complete